jgi:ParB-like chromosome segregation protein Spo0J
MPSTTPGAKRADGESMPPESIHLIEVGNNLRFDLGPESELEELTQSIAKNGQLEEVVLRQDGARVIMIAGERRLAAVKRINADPARYGLDGPIALRFKKRTKTSEDEALELTADENTCRRAFSVADLAHACLKLDRRGYSPDDAARILRLGSPQRFRQLLAINEWPDATFLRLHRGEITEELGKQLATLDPYEAEKLASEVDEGEKVSEVTKKAKDAKREKGIRTSRTMAELRAECDRMPECQQAQLLRKWVDGEPGVTWRHLELGTVAGEDSLALLGEWSGIEGVEEAA